jgi:hypothetical protein
MKKLHVLAVGAVMMFGLAGCEKTKVANQAAADVFVKAIRNPLDTSKTVYAAIHSVFSYNSMTSVGVTSPGGATMQLTDFDNSGMSFYNEPADTAYKPTPPTTGVYNYIVKFYDGEQLSYTNTLLNSIIAPVIITSLAKSAGGDSVYIAWKAVTDAQGYQFKITKGITQVYYQKPFSISGSNPRVGFPLSGFTSFGPGTFTFELDALLFESATVYDYLQAIGSAKKDIVL